MNIIPIAFALFLIMNSLGVIPVVLGLLHKATPSRQRKIIFREMIFVLILMLFFNFFGEVFFDWLNIDDSNIRIAGGLILFIIALRMVFPVFKKSDAEDEHDEPFIVPIATPLVAGPSVLAAVMFYAKESQNLWEMVLAILLAWAASSILLILAPHLQRWIGDKGLGAFQRLMGLILTLIAVQMFLQGISRFITHSFYP